MAEIGSLERARAVQAMATGLPARSAGTGMAQPSPLKDRNALASRYQGMVLA